MNFNAFFVIKYISLVFHGIANHLTPIVTMVLSYFTLNERFKGSDIIFTAISLCGATLTTLGIKENKKQAKKVNDKGFENMKIIAMVSLTLTTLISAWANITSGKMKDLHKLTPGVYINISMIFFIGAVIMIKGEMGHLMKVFENA